MRENNLIRLSRGTGQKLRRLQEEMKKQFGPGNRKLDLTTKSMIPNAGQIEQIILDMLLASVKPEESRFPQFKVTFGKPFTLDDHALIFEKPKLWCVEELVKLAPAVVQPNGHIGVWPYNMDLLLIWGIQTLRPMQTTFEVIDPGRITLSFGMGSKVAEITGKKADFISSEWNSACHSLMARNIADNDDSWIADLMRLFYTNAIREILRRMRQLRHGGTIIIVPDTNQWQKSVARPIFYSCRQRLSQTRPIAESMLERLREIDNDPSKDDRLKMHSGMKLFADFDYRAFLGDAARTIAYLGSVDGAIVLTSDLDVIGFGAKIKTSNLGLALVQFPGNVFAF